MATQSTNQYLHIVPVGTSILTNSGWKNDEPLPKRKVLLNWLRKEPRQRSAELNALVPFIEKGQCSVVHLIATDTPESKLCSDVIGSFLSQWKIGLTKADAQDLSFQPLDRSDSEETFYAGVRHFRELVFRIVQRARKRGQRVFINATGGLKAETAVAAIVAAELSVDAYYIHQSMEQPVYLPTTAVSPRILALLSKIKAYHARVDTVKIPDDDLLRLEREGLVRLTRNPYGKLRNVRLTKYGKYLLENNGR